MKLDDTTTRALLERFGIRFAKGERAVPAGTDIAIEGRIDETGRQIVRVRSAAHSAERLVPLGEVAANELVDGLRAHHHYLKEEAERRMLAHLFLHVSDLFVNSGVEGFSLDPVRLHENGYTVVSATFSAPSAIHVAQRLDRHAHDRKSFRASGRQ